MRRFQAEIMEIMGSINWCNIYQRDKPSSGPTKSKIRAASSNWSRFLGSETRHLFNRYRKSVIAKPIPMLVSLES